MLDVLRRNASSWAIKIILGFIAITFVWWGVGTYTESGRDTAAKVGGTVITVGELSRETQAMEKVYRDVYGAAFTPEMEKALNLRRQALDTLIQRTILLEEAKRLGLSATDGEVQREIAQTPAFQVDGQFREDRYRSLLQYSRVSPAEYEESKRQEITLRKVQGLLANGARVTEGEALEYYRLTGRKIRLVVAEADPARISGAAQPTEAEIRERYDKTRESYRVPAKVRLLVARFDPAHFGKEYQPTEAEVKAFQEGNPEKFRSEEKRLVARILVPAGKNREEARRKADALLPRLGKGKDEFDAAVKAAGKNGTRETWVDRKDLPSEVADPVFKASVDAVVGPVETPAGLVFARINRIRFPEALPLAQVRDRVVALLRFEKGKDAAVVKAYEAQRKAAEKKDLKAVLGAYGVAPSETGWESGDPAAGSAAAVPPGIVQEALLLPTGEVGPVKPVGDSYWLFQVAAKEESKVPELSVVRERVAAAIMAERRRQAARAAAQKVLSESTSAESLAAKARAAGLAVATTDLFSPLSDPLPKMLADVADARRELAVLSMKKPMAAKVLEAGGRDFAVACGAEQEADESRWSEKRPSYVQQLAEQKKNRMLEAFIADRRRQAKVEINPDALK